MRPPIIPIFLFSFSLTSAERSFEKDDDFLRCSSRGQGRVLCHEECMAGQCWQQTVLDGCSCSGYRNHVKEMAVFGYDGTARSAPGLGAVDLCSPCWQRCSTEDRGGLPASRSYTPAVNHTFKEECIPKAAGADVEPIDKLVGPGETEHTCLDPGNLTRLCTETCAQDGRTCVTSVDIHACTCAGVRLIFEETTMYDIQTGEEIVEQTALPGARYSRVCGDCTNFCRSWPGETKSYYVNTLITSCHLILGNPINEGNETFEENETIEGNGIIEAKEDYELASTREDEEHGEGGQSLEQEDDVDILEDDHSPENLSG